MTKPKSVHYIDNEKFLKEMIIGGVTNLSTILILLNYFPLKMMQLELQHCYLEIDESNKEEGIALPYIVTVEEQSRKVLCVRRNYKPDDTNKEKINHFVHYRFVPGFGFYGFGLMHFLGNLTMSATAAMRSLVDAGQFANLPGGFKAKGVRMVGDNDPISPGEFKEVESTGVDLAKAIVPLPYKEPSSTLFQMLGFVTAAPNLVSPDQE